MFKVEGFVKRLKISFSVIPAKAGIQYFQMVLDACLRRHDGISEFLRVCQDWTFDVHLYNTYQALCPMPHALCHWPAIHHKKTRIKRPLMLSEGEALWVKC